MTNLWSTRRTIDVTWCKGRSGTGKAISNISKILGANELVEDILDRISKICLDSIPRNSQCLCHGNARILDFFITCYELTLNPVFLERGITVFNYILDPSFYDSMGYLTIADETKRKNVLDYGVGLLGTLDVLSKLNKLVKEEKI